MPFEKRPGTGTLFKNTKRNNDRAPNLKGDALIEIDGRLYELELAAWTKESERAGKFLSLTVKLKGTQPHANGGRAGFRQRVEEIGEQIDGDIGPEPDPERW